MRFVDTYSEMKDPLYLNFEKTRDLDDFPKNFSLTDHNKWQAETVEELLKEIFFLLDNSEIKSLHRKIIVEPIAQPPNELYDEYSQNEEGDYVGVGEPTGYSEPQIGIFVQLIGSKFDQG
jgi:hypothetical protein